jgi:outer membrane lipoprotein-sorting protein
MHKFRRLIVGATFALLLLAVRSTNAAPPDEKDRVLRRLDAVAANFHTTSADFQFDTYQTDPIPDHEWQKGTVYYERKAGSFQTAAHIRETNGKPTPKMYIYSDGKLRLVEPMIHQVTTIAKAGKYESYLMLGFGASGKNLEQKWEINYLGSDTLLDGQTKVKTEMLELIAKDPEVRKMFPKITIWVDLARGVSMKQVFDEGQGQKRVSVYFNIKVNETLPDDAFTFKTDSKWQYVTH